MTDPLELIANVYRACGWHEDEDGDFHHNDAGECVLVEDVGLDAFIRDIVPALDAKDLEVTIWRRNLKWQVDISEIPTGMVLFATARYDSPVEACFRAAYEALKDD